MNHDEVIMRMTDNLHNRAKYGMIEKEEAEKIIYLLKPFLDASFNDEVEE